MDNPELEKLLAEFPKDGEYAVKSINTALLKASLRKAHDLGVAFEQAALADKMKAQRDDVLEEAAQFAELSKDNVSHTDHNPRKIATGLRALKSQPNLSGAEQAVVEAAIAWATIPGDQMEKDSALLDAVHDLQSAQAKEAAP